MVDIIRIDVDAIRANTKQRWLIGQRNGTGFLVRLQQSIPWWLVVIAAVMFLLSAPHTAAIFDRLTPGIGKIAPLGVEFGLLYAAFRRKRSRSLAEPVPVALWILEGLLFITAIIVNGAGSLVAVASVVGVQDLSAQSITLQFAQMPVITQVTLFLVPVAALIIPIGTSVTGEGLANLIYEKDQDEIRLEARWQAVEFNELRKAFFTAYTEKGMRPADAKRQATVLASGFIEQAQVQVAPARAQVAGFTVPPVLSDETTGQGEELIGGRDITKQDQARRLLADNPDFASLSLRELEARTGIGKNVWHIVRRK